ncbi:MmpS family transport accessory protein [Mycolicibacterium sp.]|uniref:MmpS family transport accessory protein n=2 Tax=Mycolicibacterium sp. TaxID=2320850 RepID=UPI003D09FFDD
MNRQYTAQSPYSLTPTERIRSPREYRRRDDGYRGEDPYGDLDTDAYPRYPDDDYEAVEDYDEYEIDEASVDRRWMWIAGVAGAILFVAVITTSVILSGGDSGSVSATVASSTEPAATSAAPTPTPSAPVVAAPPAPAPSLPAETVTTVSPTAETSTAAPQPLLPAPQAAPPPPSAAPGTVTYQITGNRQLLDLVTVIYTDAQGALQTDVNVALPWSKTVVLDPGVTLSSVTATSVGGQLNCSITDANGNLIAVQNSNSMITNCTR